MSFEFGESGNIMKKALLFGFLLAIFITDGRPQTNGQPTVSPVATENKSLVDHMNDKTGRKRALLIGVYYGTGRDGEGKWPPIKSSVSLRRMADVLLNRAGFEPQNIKILTETSFTAHYKGIEWNVCSETSAFKTCNVRAQLPTRTNIENEIKTFLTEQALPGDDAVLYFIGHGQSLTDVPPKDEEDDCDESLVPYDYVLTTDGSNNLVDDDIGTYLDSLSEKKPNSVTIIFDSCFAGTGTRNDIDENGAGGSLSLCKSKKTVEKPALTAVDRNKLPPKFVFLAASASYETAWKADEERVKKNKGMEAGEGLFTYYLTEALENARPITGYENLIETVRKKLKRIQTPQLEGDSAMPIFGTGIPVKEASSGKLAPGPAAVTPRRP
jgi:hypothetical protein